MDRLGAMNARRLPGLVFDEPEHGRVRLRGADLARAAVGIVRVVGWKRARRPHQATLAARPAREHAPANFVDTHDGAAPLVIAGDYPPDAHSPASSHRVHSVSAPTAART